MRIDLNLGSMFAHNRLSTNSDILAKSIERLNSGLRINSNPQSDRFTISLEARRLNESTKAIAAQNQISQTIDKIQTTDGGFGETNQVLIRMKELATQASSDDYKDSDRTSLQEEFNSLKKKGDMRLEGLGISDLSISSKTDATAALSKIDEAMPTIQDQRSSIIGELNGRLDEMYRNTQLGIESSKDSSIDIEELKRRALESVKESEEAAKKNKEKYAPGINNLHDLNPNRVLQLL